MKYSRGTRLRYRSEYYRRGFNLVADPEWLANMTPTEQQNYQYREFRRKSDREWLRRVPKAFHLRINEGTRLRDLLDRLRAESTDGTLKSLSPVAKEIAREAFRKYTQLLKRQMEQERDAMLFGTEKW